MSTIEKIKYIFTLSKNLVSPYKLSFIWIILLGFLSGITGSVGIGIVIPLFSLLLNSKVAGTDFITRTVEKLFSIVHLPLTPTFLIGFIVLLFSLKALAQFFAKYNTEKFSAHFEEDLRKELFGKTLKANWPYLLNQKIGYLERILLDDTAQVTGIFSHINGSILILTSFITYAFIAFKISASITLLTLIFGGILFFVFKPLFFKTRKIAQEIGLTFKMVAHHIGENIMGAKIVKITSTEEKVIEKSADYFEKLRTARIKMGFYSYSLGSFLEPVGIAFIGLLFMFFYRSPDFNIVSFGVVVYLIQKLFFYIQSTQTQIQGFNGLIPYMEIVSEYRKDAVANKEISHGPSQFSFNRMLEFKKVKFSYGKERVILSDINFSVKNGEVVGIIGPSGAGKTTIVDLMLRLFSPQSGEILLDDKNISEINLKEWRRSIGYVPQDVFLLNDTIENNIKFYDDSIAKETIIQASKMANIYETIEKLPDKFDTIVGERGVKLSGGQRQRVVLARALVRKPQILILDEATSAIDIESEKLIQEAIYKLRGKITILIIAHRLSTITNSDKIVIVDEGRVAEEGSPDILLKNKDSHFSKLYNLTD